MNTEPQTLWREFRITRIIWIAIFVALVIYVNLGHVLVGKEFVDTATIPLALIRAVLAAVGGVMLVGSYFVRRRILEEKTGVAAPDPTRAASRYRSATMITAGICEAVGLFGLVLIFLGDGLATLYLFNVVAAVALVLHRPRMEELEKLAGGGPM
jgi:purine-cytosine permease-like protein